LLRYNVNIRNKDKKSYNISSIYRRRRLLKLTVSKTNIKLNIDKEFVSKKLDIL